MHDKKTAKWRLWYVCSSLVVPFTVVENKVFGKNVRNKELKNRRSLRVALHTFPSGLCAPCMRHSTIGRNKNRRMQEPRISGLCASCAACTLVPSQESKNLRIEERKNRKHINRGTQESKITERCAQCTLVLLDVSRIEERKNRRTQEPMSSGLCEHTPHAH